MGALLIAWRGGWPREARRKGWISSGGAVGGLGGMGAVIVALAIGGPVGRLKGRIGPVEIDAKETRHDRVHPFLEEGSSARCDRAGLMYFGKTAAERRSSQLSGQLREAVSIIDNERQAVRDRTMLARAQDAAKAARAERDQEIITKETVSEYQKDIAALRARAAERVRPATAATDKVVAEARQCPAFPKPPAELMVPPAKTDFLPATP